MRILLINPPVTHKENKRTYSIEPLGLLSLATYIIKEIAKKRIQISIKILDAHFEGSDKAIHTPKGYRSGMSNQEIVKYLFDFEPDLVGVSCNYTNHVNDFVNLCNLVKNTLPNCTLVVGGAHATIDHKRLAKLGSIDAIVRGEGEETFKQIVLALNRKEGFKGISGVTYVLNENVIVNPNRPPIEDLNVLPIPDRSFIDYNKYLDKTSSEYFVPMNVPVGTIFSSRGCPYQCVFCSTQKVWSNKWRGRNAENMLKEVKYLIENYGAKEISFQDDQFMGNRRRIIEFCNLVIENKLNVSFIVPSGISPSLLNKKILQLMKKAGFYRICFSIDVGTEESRKFVGKPVNLGGMRKLIRYANSIGLWTYATFVIGFPFEKVSDIKKTIKFAYNLKLDFVRFYIAQPHLGSELYDIYLKDKLLHENQKINHSSMYSSLFGTKHMSKKELMTLRDNAEFNYLRYHLKHFVNPSYFISEFMPKIFSSKKNFKYFFRLLFLFLKKKSGVLLHGKN